MARISKKLSQAENSSSKLKQAGKALSNKFFLAALALMLIAGTAIAFFIQTQVEQAMLQNYAEAVSKATRATVTGYLSADDFKTPLTGKRYERFEQFSKRYLPIDDIASVELWNRQGTVIFSDHKEIVGKSFLLKPDLRAALEGRSQVQIIGELDHGTGTNERLPNTELIEVYAPVKDKGKIIGVYEVYFSAIPLRNKVNSSRMTVFAGFGLLYLILFALAKIGSAILNRESARLTDLATPELLELPDAMVLTGRERQILRLMASNLGNKQIAKELDISTFTVAVHCRSIYRKLNVNNRYDAIHLAVKTGILE